jgi:Tfp pilus assembly protein PilO
VNPSWTRTLRNHPLTWGLPLALLAINLLIFAFYQVAYAGKVEALRTRFESDNTDLRELTAKRQEIDDYLSRVRTGRGAIHTLYLDHFQTADQRLTATLEEIESLGSKAGLKPSAFSYPTQDLKDLQLREMGISFGVDGTYEQLRRFINLLELSDQFMILRSISLNRSGKAGSSSPKLSLSVSMATLFLTEELAAKTRAARAAEQAAANVSDDRDTSPASSVEPLAETDGAIRAENAVEEATVEESEAPIDETL